MHANLRPVALAVGAIALLLVVAAAAGISGGASHPAHAGASPGAPGSPNWSGEAMLGFVAAAGTWLAYALWRGWSRKRRPRRENPLPWWFWPLLVAIAAAIAAGILALLSVLSRTKAHHLSPSGLAKLASNPGLGRARLPQHLAHPAAASLSWWPVLAGALVATMALVALWALRRRAAARSRPPAEAPAEVPAPTDLGEQRQEVVKVLDESLEAVEAEPDPRKAVIAAYARMERWMARAGLGRRLSEAPFEHLDRVVGLLGATVAVSATLAGLFERAKFDRRPCGPEMKQEALAALRRLRQELADIQAAPATEAGAA
ncbi:MAG: DUF4129 domain-containing protein [Acidimicrobiales bacterium]